MSTVNSEQTMATDRPVDMDAQQGDDGQPLPPMDAVLAKVVTKVTGGRAHWSQLQAGTMLDGF